jgi:hypothetical protein
MFSFKKHHGNIVSKCKSNISQKILPSEKMETNVSQLSANVNLNKKTYYGFSCDFCGITYIHRQSKYKHQIKCKNKLVGEEKKSEQKEIINLLIEQIKTQKEQLELFKEQENIDGIIK